MGEILLALLASCAAGLVRGYSGFGSALVMVPLLSIIWVPAEAVAITVGAGLVTAVQMSPRAIKIAKTLASSPRSDIRVAARKRLLDAQVSDLVHKGRDE